MFNIGINYLKRFVLIFSISTILKRKLNLKLSKTCEHDVHTVQCTYTVSDTCSKSNSSIMYCKNENIYQGTKVIMQGKFIAVAYILSGRNL